MGGDSTSIVWSEVRGWEMRMREDLDYFWIFSAWFKNYKNYQINSEIRKILLSIKEFGVEVLGGNIGQISIA